jgi:hypothetical protein
MFDAEFPFIYKDPEAFLDDVYGRVVALCRYLRQPLDWAWRLDHQEALRYERVLAKILKAEAGGDSPAPGLPPSSPWGFGDYEL